MKNDPTEGWLSKLKDDCGSDYIDCRRQKAFWEAVIQNAETAISYIDKHGLIEGRFGTAKDFSEKRGRSISNAYNFFIGQYRDKKGRD